MVQGPLAAVIGAIVQVGRIFGSVFAPIIELTTSLFMKLAEVMLWFYNNVIRHLLNGIITVFNLVFDVFHGLVQVVTDVANAMIDFANKFRRESKEKDHISNPLGDARRMDEGWLDAISMEDLTATGLASGGTISGTPAQYTTGSTINQDIDIHTSIIAGEGGIRELALIIRDEIRSAEALGA